MFSAHYDMLDDRTAQSHKNDIVPDKYQLNEPIPSLKNIKY